MSVTLEKVEWFHLDHFLILTDFFEVVSVQLEGAGIEFLKIV